MSYRINRLGSASQRSHLPFQNKGTGAQRGGLVSGHPGEPWHSQWWIQLWVLLYCFMGDQHSSFLTEVSHLFLNVLTVAWGSAPLGLQSISVPLRYFCHSGRFTSRVLSKGCFLPALIMYFQLHSKGGHFYGTEQKFHLIDLTNTVRQSINKGSGPVFSWLALRVVYLEAYYKTWTWANLWSPLEREGTNLVTLSVQVCSRPCLCSGEMQKLDPGHYVRKRSELTSYGDSL